MLRLEINLNERKPKKNLHIFISIFEDKGILLEAHTSAYFVRFTYRMDLDVRRTARVNRKFRHFVNLFLEEGDGSRQNNDK